MRNAREVGILVLGVLAGLLIYHFAFPLVFPPVVALFSPEEGDRIIELIDSARYRLDIEMYVFSSPGVLEALKRAERRGVDVRIILERRTISEGNDKIFEELSLYGIPVRWASKDYKLTHAKFLIMDGEKVLVGSHNWSDSALYRNREASVIISGPVVREFQRVFEKDWMLAA